MLYKLYKDILLTSKQNQRLEFDISQRFCSSCGLHMTIYENAKKMTMNGNLFR